VREVHDRTTQCVAADAEREEAGALGLVRHRRHHQQRHSVDDEGLPAVPVGVLPGRRCRRSVGGGSRCRRCVTDAQDEVLRHELARQRCQSIRALPLVLRARRSEEQREARPGVLEVAGDEARPRYGERAFPCVGRGGGVVGGVGPGERRRLGGAPDRDRAAQRDPAIDDRAQLGSGASLVLRAVRRDGHLVEDPQRLVEATGDDGGPRKGGRVGRHRRTRRRRIVVGERRRTDGEQEHADGRSPEELLPDQPRPPARVK